MFAYMSFASFFFVFWLNNKKSRLSRLSRIRMRFVYGISYMLGRRIVAIIFWLEHNFSNTGVPTFRLKC